MLLKREKYENQARYTKRLVKFIREKYKGKSIEEICDEEEIYIKYCDLGEINGYYFEFLETKIIKLNYSLSSSKCIEILAHELGHYFLHRDLDIFSIQKNTLLLRSRFELEANIFAAELLISDSDLSDMIDYSIDHASMILGVRKDLIELKMNTFI